jgi:hypothetical protein
MSKMLNFFFIFVCMCACIVCMNVCAHLPLFVSVSEHVHGLPTKYSPLFFVVGYLLVDSIDFAKTFGLFSLTVNLATHSFFFCSMSLTVLRGAAAVLVSVRNI